MDFLIVNTKEETSRRILVNPLHIMEIQEGSDGTCLIVMPPGIGDIPVMNSLDSLTLQLKACTIRVDEIKVDLKGNTFSTNGHGGKFT